MTVSTNPQHSLGDLGINSQRFTNKDDIKPWLQNFLLHKKGIYVVIARSDANKIVFRCKSGKNKEPSDRKTMTSRRQISCPFKIRANYSIRNNLWTLVVINETHDHELDNFGFTQQSKLAYLFNHRKNDEPELVPPGASDTTSILTAPSKSNTTSDVFSAFMPSTGMASPPQNHDTLDLSIDELKDADTSKENCDTEKLVSGFQYQRSKRRKLSGRHNTKKKKINNDTITLHHEEQHSQPEKSGKDVIDDLREQINVLISNNIINNQNFVDKEKSLMIKSFFSTFISDYRNIINTVASQQKNTLSSWLNTSSSAQPNLHSHANTNLIPLSPLLNDTDTEHTGATPNNNSNNQSIDNLTHLPNMSLGSSLMTNIGTSNNNIGSSNVNTSNNYNNFMIPPQMQLLQIQNQNQQLPSFNTIQNQLPLSPTSLANNSTASLFVNNFNNTNLNLNLNSNSSSSSLIPPINNSNANTTLNPSHLLKSSNNKNSMFNNNTNHSTSNNLISRNEYKQNSSSNSISNTNMNISNTMSLNANHNTGTMSNPNYGGLSSPNNNIINQNVQNNSTNGSFYSKEIMSSVANGNQQNSTPSNTSGVLNHITNMTDNGW